MLLAISTLNCINCHVSLTLQLSHNSQFVQCVCSLWEHTLDDWHCNRSAATWVLGPFLYLAHVGIGTSILPKSHQLYNTHMQHMHTLFQRKGDMFSVQRLQRWWIQWFSWQTFRRSSDSFISESINILWHTHHFLKTAGAPISMAKQGFSHWEPAGLRRLKRARFEEFHMFHELPRVLQAYQINRLLSIGFHKFPENYNVQR